MSAEQNPARIERIWVDTPQHSGTKTLRAFTSASLESLPLIFRCTKLAAALQSELLSSAEPKTEIERAISVLLLLALAAARTGSKERESEWSLRAKLRGRKYELNKSRAGEVYDSERNKYVKEEKSGWVEVRRAQYMWEKSVLRWAVRWLKQNNLTSDSFNYGIHGSEILRKNIYIFSTPFHTHHGHTSTVNRL